MVPEEEEITHILRGGNNDFDESRLLTLADRRKVYDNFPKGVRSKFDHESEKLLAEDFIAKLAERDALMTQIIDFQQRRRQNLDDVGVINHT